MPRLKRNAPMPSDALIQSEGGIVRCWWCGDDPEYVRYHDEEWGKPVTDDRRLFEKLCLEGFQAGLSWLTILRKREEFRNAFRDFHIESVAKFTTKDVTRLLENAGIVRHRGKIESVINNAARAIDLIEEHGSLSGYLRRFEPQRVPLIHIRGDVAAMTAESTLLSKDLKRRGWSFVGPTTCYAFMQSMGIVNDHVVGCQFRGSI